MKAVPPFDAPRPATTGRSLADALVERLERGEVKLPMLPNVASETLALTHKASMSFQAVDRVLRKDALLTARVVAIANSARYRGQQDVTSLRASLLRLGCGTLREILCRAVAEAHVFRGGATRLLRRELDHAVMVGHVAGQVCGIAGVDGDYAFLCGLLHDLAIPILHDNAESFPELAKKPEAELIAAIDAAHTAAGAHLARNWHLPELVLEAVTRHHDYGEPHQPTYSRIGNVIAAAEIICEGLGAGDGIVHPRDPEVVFGHLGLTRTDIDRLQESARDLRDADAA